MPAGVVYDEQTRLLWFPTADEPADIDAITAVEIAADGIDLSGYVIPDGITFGFGNSRVSGADLLTAFDSESMGRHQAAPSVMFKRKLRETFEGDDDLAWQTFKTRKTGGTLVVFLALDPGADPGTGDEYVAFPACESGQPVLQNTAVNAEVRFQIDFAVGEAPVFGTVVAS